MIFAGYYVNFDQQIMEEKKIEDTEVTLDCCLLLDERITVEVIASIKEKLMFVATEHSRQGATQEELSMWKNKRTEYVVILKGILIHSTKKQLHVLGLISINGEQLHICMYNNSSRHPFDLKKGALRGEFGKTIHLPKTIKFKCIPYCH